MRNNQNVIVGYVAWTMFALTVLSIVALVAGLHLPQIAHAKVAG